MGARATPADDGRLERRRLDPYANADNVSRRGVRLSDTQALALLRETRRRAGAVAPLSDEEAQVALSSRLRRG